MSLNGFVYLASPYSHDDQSVRNYRFIKVCEAAAELMLAGHVVFSPIARSHCIELHGIGEVKDGDFWKRQDVPLLLKASTLVVLMLPGWEESSGLKWEQEIANKIGIPIIYIEPEAE